MSNYFLVSDSLTYINNQAENIFRKMNFKSESPDYPYSLLA